MHRLAPQSDRSSWFGGTSPRLSPDHSQQPRNQVACMTRTLCDSDWFCLPVTAILGPCESVPVLACGLLCATTCLGAVTRRALSFGRRAYVQVSQGSATGFHEATSQPVHRDQNLDLVGSPWHVSISKKRAIPPYHTIQCVSCGLADPIRVAFLSPPSLFSC